MDLANWPLPREMDLANQLPPEEVLLCQTSSLYPNYAAIGAVSLPAQAVVGRVALVSLGRPVLPSRGRASWRKAAVLSSVFQLPIAQGRESGPERRFGSSACSSRPFVFRPMRLLAHPRHSLALVTDSLFRLGLSRVPPVPFSVERAVVQRLNLVFGTSKSSRKRSASKG